MALIDPKNCPYYLISRVSLVITSALKKGFVDADVKQVSPAYLGVLMSLWKEDCLKVIELSRRAGLEPSTMTGLIDRMERDSLVTRSPDPKDRRSQLICLTKEGKTVQTSVLEVIDLVLAHIFNTIPDNELENTKNLLRQVLDNSGKGKHS